MQNKVRFTSNSGHELAGTVHRPDSGGTQAWALFAHCFTCTRNLKAAAMIADALCAEGIGVLRFDFTGLGDSEGEFADTHFSSNVDDLTAAAAYLEREHEAPQILVGHSLGGTAILAAAPSIESARAVATIGSPAEAEHVLRLIDSDIQTIEDDGEATVRLAGRPFRLRREFVDDVRAQKVRDGVSSIRRALLIMHSPLDELVSIDEAARIYSSAKHPKSFVSLDRADHLLSDPDDARYAGRVLASWATRYLSTAGKEPASAPRAAGAVTVSGRTADMFRVAINADGYALAGDEPESVGGGGSGPTPYDYLSAALGSCTVMTLNMYARRKNMKLDTVIATVRHGKIHANDCEHCETRSGRIDRFETELQVEGDLSGEERGRLLEIAERCPVHRSLKSEVDMQTRLVGS